VSGKELNLLELISAMLLLRKITLGSEIKLNIGGENITLTVEYIENIFNKDVSVFTYTIGNKVLHIGCPKVFITDEYDIPMFVLSSIQKITLTNGQEIDMSNTNKSDLKELFNILHGLPVVDIYKEQCKKLENFLIKLGREEITTITLLNSSIISLLKVIFNIHIQEVLDLEYNLRKHMGMSYYDFENTPYIECKIMYSKLKSEQKNDSDGNTQQQE
jgi:hypothetical protein